jgi:hypothetical protein
MIFCLGLLGLIAVGWLVYGSVTAGKLQDMQQLRWPTLAVDDDGDDFGSNEILVDFERMLFVHESSYWPHGGGPARIYELRRVGRQWEARESASSREAYLRYAEEVSGLENWSPQPTPTELDALRREPTWKAIQSHSLAATLEASYQRFARSYKPVPWTNSPLDEAVRAAAERARTKVDEASSVEQVQPTKRPLPVRPRSARQVEGEVRAFKCPSCAFETDPSRHSWDTVRETGACPSCNEVSAASRKWAKPS